MARSKVDIKTFPRELARMRQRLDHWRSSHSRGTAFPETLWAAAGRLAEKHGVYVSSRVLGLEYNKLKRASGGDVGRVRVEAKRRSIAKPVKFIELTGALAMSPGGCRLSLQGPAGQRLALEMAPGAAAEVVVQLCRSGWGAS